MAVPFHSNCFQKVNDRLSVKLDCVDYLVLSKNTLFSWFLWHHSIYLSFYLFNHFFVFSEILYLCSFHTHNCCSMFIPRVFSHFLWGISTTHITLIPTNVNNFIFLSPVQPTCWRTRSQRLQRLTSQQLSPKIS